MKNSKIEAGSIVKFVDANVDRGYYRVTSARGGKVNLGSIFGRSIYHKGILIENVVECQDEWYSNWQKSETYQCM
jgi:hypothetical protein